MIDNFALAVSHGLILLTAWLLTRRPDLDHEPSEHGPSPHHKGKPPRA